MAKASDNQFPSVLFGEGSTPTSPAASTQRLFIDSADHKLKRVNSSGSVTTIEGGASGAGVLLASVSYQPGSDTSPTPSATGGTWQAIDSTNLTITFTATSTAVIVGLCAVPVYPNTIGDRYYWGLGTGGTLATGASQILAAQSNVSSVVRHRLTQHLKVSGLTAGNSYTWQWLHMAISSSATTAQTMYGPSFGPALMTVISA